MRLRMMTCGMTTLAVSVLVLVSVVSSGFAIQPSGEYDERDRERETYVEREPYYRSPLVIDVWTDQGEGAVYHPGERIRVYFRASRDCYVTIYNIDTQGYVHLLYPGGDFDEHFVMGGVTYRVPSRRAPYELVVGGPPGIEYVEAIASVEPFHSRPPWYLDPQYGEWEENPWTLYGSDYEDYAEDYDYYAERGIVRGDPFLAIQSINRRIIPGDYPSSYYATAYTSFYIGRTVHYPRYLCFDCHWDHPGFNPYGAGCIVFDIRIDRTWVYSPRIVLRDYRPRYYYSLRDNAPVRYRGERHFWSSKDGLMTLRREFAVSKPKIAPSGPGYVPGGKERWQEGMGPSDLRKWKSGREPSAPAKLQGLKQRLESEGMLRQKQYEKEPEQYQERYQQKSQEKSQYQQKQESSEAERKEVQRVQEQKKKQQQQQEQEKEKESYQKKPQTRVRAEAEKKKTETAKTQKQATEKVKVKAEERHTSKTPR